MITSRAILSLLVCLFIALAAAPSLYAIDECWNERKHEVHGRVCVSIVPDFSGSYYRVSCAGIPENGCSGCSPIGEAVWSIPVHVETGYKCAMIGTSVKPSTYMIGMSGSFQQWWNQYVEAPANTGPTGPVISYEINKGGWSSCRPKSADEIVSLPGYPGVTFTQRVWWTSIGGSYCERNLYVIGTGGG